MAKKWLNGLDERLQYEKDDMALKSVLPNVKQCVSVKWNDKPGEYKAYYLGNNLWRIEITPRFRSLECSINSTTPQSAQAQSHPGTTSHPARPGPCNSRATVRRYSRGK